ncbi:MAG: glycoside hydrolase family 88 protein [Mariniphaga sp.]
MKSKKTIVILVIVLLATCFANAQTLPSKKEIMDNMVLTNFYFMNKWPDTGKSIITNKERPSNIWTRAVYYEGLMALYAINSDKAYYDYAVSWGEAHKWGLRDGIKTRNADNQCCGQTYLDLYEIDKKPERLKDIKASVDLMLATDKIDDWTWIDALQMAMPLFAKLGKITGEKQYSERMYQMYMDSKVKQGFYNPKDKLWWRDKDFKPTYKEPNGEDCYWSRGNGWVVAALVKVLEILPKDDPHRKEYQKTYLDMMKALVPIQRADGFWNASLHDPNNYGGKELSGTALFAYGMAWGVNNGLLSAKKYKPVITKAWNAMVNDAVHANGFLGFVQGTGKQPSDSQPVTYDSIPDFEDYGLGCFLLAGCEIYKL